MAGDFFVNRAMKYISYYLLLSFSIAVFSFVILFNFKTQNYFNENKVKVAEIINNNYYAQADLLKEAEKEVEKLKYDYIKNITNYVFLIVLFVYLLSLLFFRYMFSILYEPMKEVLDAIDHMSQGKTNVKVRLTGRRSSRALAEKINKLAKNINFIKKMKEEFLVKKSYEFNNTVYSIVSLTEEISNKKNNNFENEKINLIKENSQQLLKLVKSLNDYYTLEDDSILVEELVNIKKIVDEVFLMSSEQIENKNIQLINDIRWEDSCVLGDNMKLYVVFSQLIENAIKNTKEGQVIIRAKRKKDKLHIYIKDTGYGITKHKLSAIRDYLINGDETSTNTLGLSLTKKILDLHSAQMDIYSKLGQGTEIILILKAKEKESEDSLREIKCKLEEEDNIDYGPRKYRLLFFCNNTLNIKLLNSYLIKNKYKIEIVETKEDLMNAIKNNYYDLLIIDYFGVWFQNYQLIQDIRKIKNKEELHILLVNNKNKGEEVQSAFKTGVNDIINKPIYKEEFLNKVNTQLKIKRTLSSIEKVNENYIKEKKERILAENLRDFHTELTSTLNVKKIFLILFRKIKYLFDYDSALVLLKQDKKYQIIFQEGSFEKEKKNDKFIKNKYLDPVVNKKRIVVINKQRCKLYFSDKIKSAIAIPLTYKKNENCLIVIKSTQEKFFKNLSKGIIDNLFYQSSIAIKNANLYGELEKRNVKLNLLIEKLRTIDKLISVIYNETDKDSAIYYLLLVLVGNKMKLGYKEAYYFEYDDSEDKLVCKNYYFNINKYNDTDEEKLKEKEMWSKNLSIPMHLENILCEVFYSGLLAYKKDLNKSDKFLLKHMENITVLPIKYENSTFGIIVLESEDKKHKNDKYEKESLSIFAANLGIYLQTKKLEEENIKYHNSKTLNTFAKSIVHELRTPLVGIKGFATMTKEKYKEDNKLYFYMNNIINDANRVIDLSSQIVDFAEEENAKYFFKNESFTQGILEVLSEFKNEIDISSLITKVFKEDFFIPYDKIKMKKVFRHIIKNSIENIDYNKDKNYLVIEKNTSEEKISISFIDNGVGIEEHILKEIFNPLVSTKIQGTGLGLTLSKKIVEKNAFEIKVESKRGFYTKVSIIIS